MAVSPVQIVINALWQGDRGVAQAQKALESVQGSAQSASSGLEQLSQRSANVHPDVAALNAEQFADSIHLIEGSAASAGASLENLAATNINITNAMRQSGNALLNMGDAGRRAALEMAAVDQRSSLLIQKMNQLASEVAKGAKSFDDAERELREYDDSLARFNVTTESTGTQSRSLVGTLGRVALAYGALRVAAAGAQRALDFARQGAEIQQVELSFDRLNATVLETPDLLEDMRQASRGTIRDFDLMAGIMTLTAGTSEELSQEFARAAPQLLEIAKAAQALNPSLGNTQFLYESLTRGIKRGERRILDNLGIVINASDAYREYARSIGVTTEELTAEERQLAILNETLEVGNNIVEQAGGSAESLTDPYEKLRVQTQGLVDDTKQFASDALLPLVRLLTDDYGDAMEAAIQANLDFEASLDQLERKARQLEEDKTFATFIKGQNDEIQAAQAEIVVAIGAQADTFEEFNQSLVDGFGSSFAAWENFIEGIQRTQTGLDIAELRILGTDQLFELVQAAEDAGIEFGEFVNVLAELSRAGTPVEDVEQFAGALNEATAADNALINSIKNLNPEFGKASTESRRVSEEFKEIIRQAEEGERAADDFSRRLAQFGQGTGIRRISGELRDFNRETTQAAQLWGAWLDVINDTNSALGRTENNIARGETALSDFVRVGVNATEELTGVAAAASGVADRVAEPFEIMQEEADNAERAIDEAQAAFERWVDEIESLTAGAVGRQFGLIDDIADARAEISELRAAVEADPGNLDLVNELEGAIERFDELAGQAGDSWNELVIDIITSTGGFDQVAADFAVAAGIMTEAQANARLEAVAMGDAIRDIGLAVDAGAITTTEGAQLFAGIQDGSITIEDALVQLDALLQGQVLPSLGEAGQQLEGLPEGVTFDYSDISEAGGAASTLGGELATVTEAAWFVEVDATAVEAATTQTQLLVDELTAVTQEPWVIDVELNQQGGDQILPALQGTGFASGTGGWTQVPGGFPNDSYGPLYFSSGELLNVIPAGGQAPGGMAVSNDNRRIAIVNNTREASALALAQVGIGRRRRRNKFMGGAG